MCSGGDNPFSNLPRNTLAIDPSSNLLLARGARDYLYDAAGNTVAFLEPDGSPRREWQYSAANRMESLFTFGQLRATYQYNALGQRVLKTLHQNNGGTAEQHQVFVFHYDQQGRLIQNGIYRPTATGVRHMRDRHFIWMDDMPVGFLETVYRVNGSVLSQDMHYIAADHLNTPRFATNELGVKSWQWTADAFGVGELDLDPDGDGVNVNIRLRFPGQYDDEESITFYNYFRDYDPTIGRYVQSDPIGLGGGINTFAYAFLSPAINIDFFGLQTGYGGTTSRRQTRVDQQYPRSCVDNCLLSSAATTIGASAIAIGVTFLFPQVTLASLVASTGTTGYFAVSGSVSTARCVGSCVEESKLVCQVGTL